MVAHIRNGHDVFVTDDGRLWIDVLRWLLSAQTVFSHARKRWHTLQAASDPAVTVIADDSEHAFGD
jgi:hypothetical protein